MSVSPLSNSTVVLEEDLSPVGVAVACIILALCFVVGAPGNLLVVWTVVRHVKPQSHTMKLILHLAAADLLVLITLPLWIYSLAHSWVFGEFTCKAMAYIIHACMYASIFLITIMSVERFLAVKYPFKMLQWKTSEAMPWILVGAWVLAFLLGVPGFITHGIEQKVNGTQQCLYVDNSVFLEIFSSCLETLVGFVIPFFTLAICYCQVMSLLRQRPNRMKQKSTFLITSVVVAFAVCWLPYHIFNVIIVAQALLEHSDERLEMPEVAMFISGALVFISSSVNPMLYAFAARHFQGGLRKSGLAKLFQEVTSYTAHSTECSDSASQKEKFSTDV